MKKLILVLSVLILFSLDCNAQDTSNTKQKVTNDILKISNTPNRYLIDAANELEVAYISGVGGCALTGILMTVSLNQKNVDRIKDINTLVYVPFIVGTVISIIEFLNATSDLKKAGRYYYK